MSPDEMKQVAQNKMMRTQEVLEKIPPIIGPDARAVAVSIDTTMLICTAELCERLDRLGNFLDDIKDGVKEQINETVSQQLKELQSDSNKKGTGDSPAGPATPRHDEGRV